jgi:ABC-type glycerol-3-phosphate transport system permease component
MANRRRLRLIFLPVWLLGLLAAIAWIVPFIWMLSTSLKSTKQILTTNISWLPRPFILSNYRFVFAGPVVQWMANSLIVTVLGTVIGVTLGALAGYALTRLRFFGRDAMFSVILASIMIPANLAVVPLYIAFLKLGVINNYPALILPTIANVITVYIFRQFFLGFPVEIEEAARVDGASRWTVFLRIAVPMARSAALASTILLFTTNWNAYLWPLLITFTQQMYTLPVGVAQYSSVSGNYTQVSSFGPAMAASTLLAIPSLLIFLFLQRYFVRGIARTGLQG